MAQNRRSKLWEFLSRRTPAERYKRFTDLLDDAQERHTAASAEYDRLSAKYGESRTARKAKRVMDREARRVDWLAKRVESAGRFIPGTEQTNI